MNIFAKLAPQTRRNMLVLFCAGLLFWSSLASLLPTLPLYIGETGASSALIGIVMGCFAIGLLLSRSTLALLADQRGRKLVLIIGMVAVAFAPIGYLFTNSIPALMGIRAFHGLSIAAFSLAYSALVVDLSPPHHRGELIGYMSLVNPLGMALGPAIGGFLHEGFGFGPAFIASAVIGMMGLLCLTQVYEPPTVIGSTGQPESSAHSENNKFWSLLFTPRVRIPATVLLLVGLSFGALSTFVPLFMRENNVDLNVGLFYTAAAIASFTIRLMVGRASDRYGRGLFITLSLILYATSMVILWQSRTSLMFLIAAVAEGAGAGMLIPMIAALMADRSYPHERGRMFSLCMVGFDLGIAFAGPILGAIAVQTGYRAIFGISAVLTWIGVLVFLIFSSKDLAASLRFALGRGGDLYAVEKLSFNE